MPLQPEPVSIEVDGERLDVWTSYELDSDLLTPADGWRVSLAIGDVPRAEQQRAQREFDRVRDLCRVNTSVRVYIGSDDAGPGFAPRSLQLAGIIDERRTAATRDRGSEIQIEGRDVAAYLTDSAVPVSLTIEPDTLFLDMVRRVVEPWGLEVTAESAEGRLLTTGQSRRETRERQRRMRAIDRGIAIGLYTREGEQLGQSPTGAEGATQAPLYLGQVPAEGIAGVDTVDDVLDRADPGELARLRASRRYANKLAPVDIETIKVKDAKPRGGETAWQFLDRHARRLGLMLWADPAGRIVVSSPNLKAETRQRLIRRRTSQADEPNNIIAGGCASSGAELYSEVRAYGRSRGGDATRSAIHASARNDAVPFTRLRVISDSSLRSAEEAERRARRELRMGRLQSQVFDYTVSGHSQFGALWATDTVVYVDDEVEGFRGSLYCIRRTFACDGKGGTMTRLRLIPPANFEL